MTIEIRFIPAGSGQEFIQRTLIVFIKEEISQPYLEAANATPGSFRGGKSYQQQKASDVTSFPHTTYLLQRSLNTQIFFVNHCFYATF
jgi:hypothetical protein